MTIYNIQDNNLNNINTRYKEENEMFQVNYLNEYNVTLNYVSKLYYMTNCA